MLVREHVEHPFHRKRIHYVDPLNTTFGNAGRDHDTMRQAGHVVFGCVLRDAGDLRAAVNARGRLPEMAGGSHGTLPAYLIRLSACDCGVPRAA
jgi:hypothetical protein